MRIPKPSELTGNLFGSPFGKRENEQVAKNLRIVAKLRGDNWLPFTWIDYTEHCTHTVTESEHSVINRFVDDDLLIEQEGKYYFTSKMIGFYMYCGEGTVIDPEKPVMR